MFRSQMSGSDVIGFTSVDIVYVYHTESLTNKSNKQVYKIDKQTTIVL